MNATIWKYPLNVEDRQTLAIPSGAELLTVQVHHDQPCLWAMVDPDAPTVARVIRIHGTGDPIPDANAIIYIATFQLHGGALVFHAFWELT